MLLRYDKNPYKYLQVKPLNSHIAESNPLSFRWVVYRFSACVYVHVLYGCLLSLSSPSKNINVDIWHGLAWLGMVWFGFVSFRVVSFRSAWIGAWWPMCCVFAPFAFKTMRIFNIWYYPSFDSPLDCVCGSVLLRVAVAVAVATYSGGDMCCVCFFQIFAYRYAMPMYSIFIYNIHIFIYTCKPPWHATDKRIYIKYS